MRKAVRAIVMRDDQMLVMNRNKFGHIYYTLIGGGVEVGETPEQAILREVAEETGLAIQNPRLVFIEEAGDPYGTQYVFLCDYMGGEPKLPEDSVEAKIAGGGKNLYVPVWLPISDLAGSPFLSETLKNALLEGLEKGFPDKSLTLQSSSEVRYTSETNEK